MKSIIYKERARQLMLFDNMERRWGLSPTNIDGFQEYCGKLFMYFEGKVAGKNLDKGQKMAFEHICESYYQPEMENTPWLSRHFAWVLVYEHNVPKEEDVMVFDKIVIDVYSSIKPEWRTPKADDVIPKFITNNGKITVLEAIEQIEKWCYEHNIPIGE